MRQKGGKGVLMSPIFIFFFYAYSVYIYVVFSAYFRLVAGAYLGGGERREESPRGAKF